MFDFIRRHVLVSVLWAVGVIMAVGSKMLDAYEAATIGLPYDAWLAIGLLIFFGATIAMVYQQHEAAPGGVPTSVATPPTTPRLANKRYTAYDLQERLKAIDILSGIIARIRSDLRPLVEETRNNWAVHLMMAEFYDRLGQIQQSSEELFGEYNMTWTEYARKFSEIDDELRSKWDNQQLIATTRELREELKRLDKDNQSPAYENIRNNKFLDHWETALSDFYNWTDDMRNRLNDQRRAYEKSEVHPLS